MAKFFKTSLLCISILLLLSGSTLAASVNITATILSKSNCKFNSKGATLAFGDLDPTAGSDITREATLTFDCNGSATIATYTITDDDGLFDIGPNKNRMLHSSITETYLPYSFSLSPATGEIEKSKGDKTPPQLTVTGTISFNDYRMAVAGPYTDTVTVTINP